MARLRGKRWMADVRAPNGERLRPTFAQQSDADAWEEEARLAILDGRPIPDPKSGLAPGKSAPGKLHSLGGLFEHVVASEWRGTRGEKTATLNAQHVVDYFGRNRDVAKITSEDIANMRVHFADKGLAAATVNRKTAALSKMLHVAHDAGVIPKMPRIKFKQELKTKFRYLDDQEQDVLLAYWTAQGDKDMHDLSAFLIDTGARCFTEAIPVRWDHFAPNFTSVTFWHTKTNSPRSVPLTSRMRAILKDRKNRAPKNAGPFCGVQHGGDVGMTIKKRTLHTKWEQMRGLTGLDEVTPHTLRHTCCTRLILGGADIKRVMTWMGHTTIATTMRYMQIKPTALEDVLHILEGKAA